jgi:hypothetical protein
VRPQITSDAAPGSKPGKRHRGSSRRLRQIRLRANWSVEFWLLIAWVAFLLLVVVPWMIRQGR